MVRNRIISVLCLAVFSFCMVYAQASGRWIKFYEDEDGIYSYRSDLKSDRDNNHFVWIQLSITSPKLRMEMTNELNSTIPVNSYLYYLEFDSGYELVKLLQLVALSKSGKVLFDGKSETLIEWGVVNDEKKKLLQALNKQLKGQSGRVYEEQNRRADRIYPETNKQSSKVYDDLLGIIKEKQRKQKEETPKQSQFEEDDRIDTDAENNYSSDETIKKETLTKKEETKAFDIVDEMPQFPGGQAALLEYIAKNVKYPVVAEDNGIQGRVIVTFVVGRDGSITDAKVVKSVDPSLDQEALRVVEAMPRWQPGKIEGKPVCVKYTVPVQFKL